MKITRTFRPSAPWEKLAAKFELYDLERDTQVDLCAVLGFTVRESVAVTLFLGLGAVAPHLQHEVAEAMNLSKQRVHQLLHSALGKIERQRYPRRPE